MEKLITRKEAARLLGISIATLDAARSSGLISFVQSENEKLLKSSPTVKEYCEKWLLMQSANIRATTLIDYTSKVKRHIIEPLGHLRMAEVTTDDIKMVLVPVSKKSASVFKSVNILYRCIFNSAEDSKVISYNPTKYLSSKGGGVPQKDREALTDEQAERLIETVRGLPPYTFVMIGLYAGLRREEILALKWDCVFLDSETPYLLVRRAWHTENNRPVILTDLKTKAAKRDIPMPEPLAECLREAKEHATSEYVIANSEGEPLSYRNGGFVLYPWRSDAHRLRLHHLHHRAAYLEFHGDSDRNGSLSDPNHCRNRRN